MLRLSDNKEREREIWRDFQRYIGRYRIEMGCLSKKYGHLDTLEDSRRSWRWEEMWGAGSIREGRNVQGEGQNLSEQGNTKRGEKQAERKAQTQGENLVQLFLTLRSPECLAQAERNWRPRGESSVWLVWWVGERGADIRAKTRRGAGIAWSSGEREARKTGTLRHTLL